MTEVALPRIIRLGARGRDVLGMQRGLMRAHVRDTAATSVCGEATVRQVQAFQRRKGLLADGEYGPQTHEAMTPFLKKDGFAMWLFNHAKPRPRTDSEAVLRQNIAKAAMVGHAHAPQISYSQGSDRMEGVTHEIHLPGFPRHADCSSFATWCYWVAGAPDPNGRDYDGFGYTGTQIENGRRVTAPEVGDLIFYGSPVSHVAVFVGNGSVVSHGSEAGPYLLPIGYRPPTQMRAYISA